MRSKLRKEVELSRQRELKSMSYLQNLKVPRSWWNRKLTGHLSVVDSSERAVYV